MSASTAQASAVQSDAKGAHLTPRQLAEREGVPLQTVYIWNMNHRSEDHADRPTCPLPPRRRPRMGRGPARPAASSVSVEDRRER